MPALYAEVRGAGRRKLLLYEHYDVQPVDPLDLWQTPPFEPAERDGRIFARGVADDKADVMGRIHALETLKELGEVPVTLRFLIEGEEEIGSKSFEKVAREPARPGHEHQDRRVLRQGGQTHGWRPPHDGDHRPRDREAAQARGFRHAGARPQARAGYRADAVPADVQYRGCHDWLPGPRFKDRAARGSDGEAGLPADPEPGPR